MDGARILCLSNKLGNTSEASGGGGPSESSKVKVDCLFRAKNDFHGFASAPCPDHYNVMGDA